MANHPIVHLEIPAGNPTAAGTFYSDVLGWQITTNTEHNYVIFQSESGPRGGFIDPANAALGYQPDRLLVYLAIDDIDVTLAVIEAHGGKTVIPKTIIPNVGEWAIFTDPNGNHLARLVSPVGRSVKIKPKKRLVPHRTGVSRENSRQ